MVEGVIKWFNSRKGYGFIATDDSRDVFVHHSHLSGDCGQLHDGDAVSFELVEGEKGLQAENVRKAVKSQ